MIAQKLPNFALIGIALGIISIAVPTESFAAKSKNKSKEASQEQKSQTSRQSALSDESSVKAQIALLGKSLAEGDVKTLCGLWTPDGDYIAVDGSLCKGRAALEKRFNGIIADDGKPQLELVPDSVRFLGSDVALSEGVVRRKNGVEGPQPETRFSIVFTKQDGNWLIYRASETALAAVPDNSEPLKALSWIIGEWSAENNGGSVHMSAQWAANHNFIVCNYLTKKSADATALESRQVIGWDPRTEQPISWHFDTTGGFGYGNWTKKDKQWLVEATGVDHDGSTTTSTNILSEADPNSFSWQSVDRKINGLAFNDTTPLKVHRVTK